MAACTLMQKIRNAKDLSESITAVLGNVLCVGESTDKTRGQLVTAIFEVKQRLF